jgi:Zn-dependent peptidase ImmA (M78 family)
MNPEETGRAAAEAFREQHGLGAAPIADLVTLIEQMLGVDVAVTDAEDHGHGMSLRDPVRGVAVIGIARTRNPMRQRSTLAHEIGHLVMDDGDFAGSGSAGDAERTRQEQGADAFARHLLVPLKGVRSMLRKRTAVTVADLSAAVQRFVASPQLVAIQLHQAGLIDAASKAEYMAYTTSQLASRHGWPDQYHALQAESDQHRAPQKLLARAVAGYVEGVVPVETIARLRGLPVEQIQHELDDAGIRPTQASIRAPADLPVPHLDFSDLDEAEQP